MRKDIVKFISSWLFAILLVQMIPCLPVEAASLEYIGEAYNDLKTDEQRKAYHLIEKGIAGLSPWIEFDDVTIYYRDLTDVVHAVCVDHPEYFWFLETGLYYFDNVYEGNLVNAFEPEYNLDGKCVSVGSQELMDAIISFHSKVNDIINGIPQNYTSEYEIALYLHDYLAENISYSLEGEHPSAYSALIHGQAACYGYSKAYQCLLNAAGIRARTITGMSDDGAGNMQGHAWNLIWIDGECHYVDVTWDDQENVTMHGYFLLTLEEISRDHYADSEFILLDCDHDPIDYYTVNQGKGTVIAKGSMTAKQLATYFRMDKLDENGAIFGCEIHYDGTLFYPWVEKIIEELKSIMGLSFMTKIYCTEINGVYYLELEDPKYLEDLSQVTSITLQAEEISLTGVGTQYALQPSITASTIWTPNLVFRSSNPSVVTVDHAGILCAVSEGTAVITASNTDGSVFDTCTVTVSSKPEHQHNLRLFTAKEATCTQEGYKDYYLCMECGHRFADEAGLEQYTEASAYVYPATGHQNVSYVKGLDSHTAKCKCGEEIRGSKEKHYDTDNDGNCDVCGAPMKKVTNTLKQGTDSVRYVWLIVIAVVVIGIVAFLIIVWRKRRTNC